MEQLMVAEPGMASGECRSGYANDAGCSCCLLMVDEEVAKRQMQWQTWRGRHVYPYR